MRDIILFIASLAGAAVFTALAMLVHPESPFWKWFLWIAAIIFGTCALALFVDVIHPGRKMFLMGGMIIGLALFLGCAVALYFAPLEIEPNATTTPSSDQHIQKQETPPSSNAVQINSPRLLMGRRWLKLSDDIFTEARGINYQSGILPPNFSELSKDEQTRVWNETTNRDMQFYAQIMGRINQLFYARIELALSEMRQNGITTPAGMGNRLVNKLDVERRAAFLGQEGRRILNEFGLDE